MSTGLAVTSSTVVASVAISSTVVASVASVPTNEVSVVFSEKDDLSTLLSVVGFSVTGSDFPDSTSTESAQCDSSEVIDSFPGDSLGFSVDASTFSLGYSVDN